MEQHSDAAGVVLDGVRGFQSLHRHKQLGSVAAVLAVVGFFAPLASAQTGGFFGPSSEVSYRLTQAGFTGFLLAVIAVALGIATFYLPSNRRNDVIYYGVAAALFGTFFSIWFVSLSLPAMISAVGHLGLGFYAMLVSFALSTWVAAMRCYDAGESA